MVHKSSIIPGLSNFIDKTVLSHYPPTSLKRIVAAGAIAIYLKQNSTIVDSILNNPLISTLGVTDDKGMVDLDSLRDAYKPEIEKAGFLRVHFPMLGDVDFVSADVDTLYNCITSIDPTTSVVNSPSKPIANGVFNT